VTGFGSFPYFGRARNAKQKVLKGNHVILLLFQTCKSFISRPDRRGKVSPSFSTTMTSRREDSWNILATCSVFEKWPTYSPRTKLMKYAMS